ncbi:hypothetical protein ACWPKS_00905 [Coraliomargarita sp. W4R72]
MNELDQYRQELERLKQSMESKYDSTVLLLSSGGIGVSVLAIQQLTEKLDPLARSLLAAGWLSWGLSCVCILGSFLTSKAALEKVIKDIDEKRKLNYDCGGFLDKLTTGLNILSGILFLMGLSLVTYAIFKSL